MRTLLSLLLTLCATVALGQTRALGSPDGRLQMTLAIDEGKALYSLTYDGQAMLLPSPLGFTADAGDFSQDLTLLGTQEKEYTDDYQLDRIKTSKVHYVANELRATLMNAEGRQFDILFRLSDNDLAFRYELPSWPDGGDGNKMSVRIMSEATGYRLPDGTKSFICPQCTPMKGWRRTKPSYEEEYQYDEPLSTPSKYGLGYTFPCLFHVGKDGWVLLSETGVDSRYCASRLSDLRADGTYKLEFPLPEENNGNGTVEPAFALPGATPWRTLTVGISLKPIVETTCPWDNVEPRYESKNTYRYGKSGWSWILWQDESVCYDDQVQYVDMAKQMGFPYILVDCGWDVTMGKEGIERLVSYAGEQGVGVFLWYSSSGWWNNIEQSPTNVMSDPIRRKAAMRWMAEIGVKGIKVDFFGGDKQETMRLYEQILSDADDNALMVIFHGCTLPRGWERMYPNYVGSEAVLASENIYFDQHFCDVEAQNTATHPFLRNTVGCMEFGGCFLSRYLNRGNDPSKKGNVRKTTDTHELATTVLFQNPIQNFAIAPENLGKVGEGGAPELCLDFLKGVPTTWDETVFIDGYPGMYCVIARRSGNRWYVAGNNATGDNLTLKLQLPMLRKDGEAKLYRDNMKTREPLLQSIRLKGSSVTVSMPNGGGFVLVQ
ncbi:MAG: glycoside hydrolase family 97 protein [Prevotellaceae bacterium]|nr:glycoside hydrolase family 97 protein [Prevotellaceae bacterium]